MLIVCTIFGQQLPCGVLLALLPLVAVMAVIYFCEKNSDVPPLESLSNEQKTWIFLHSIDPSLSASVLAAWGVDKSWSYIDGVGSLAARSAKLAPKVAKEFCRCAAAFPEHQKIKADTAVIGEFLEVCYNGDSRALAADLYRIWPAEVKVSAVKPETVEAAEAPQAVPSESAADSTVLEHTNNRSNNKADE
ncbi:MAG: hypothetical protein ACI38Q_04880 [Candidatus Bruticola sp.]